MNLYDIDKNAGFLLSQKALIVNGGKLLLLENINNTWELPGGILEFNETKEKGLKREVKEETGLNIEMDSLFCIWDHLIPDFKLLDGRLLNMRIFEIAYKCTAKTSSIELSHEHIDYVWADVGTLGSLNINDNSGYAVNKYYKH